MINKSVQYGYAARHFMEQAFDELEAGDLRQASEKGWGAAAQSVKAVAEKRGWNHRSHDDLFVVARNIQIELQDPDIAMAFGAAGMLHTNFYEGYLEEDWIRVYLDRVQTMVVTVLRLLD